MAEAAPRRCWSANPRWRRSRSRWPRPRPARRIALVYGEAGIGKTSLVDHFTRARAGSARTLWGACDSLHTPRLLGPVYDIAAQAGPGLRERLEAGASPRDIFSAVLEELGRRPRVVRA